MDLSHLPQRFDLEGSVNFRDMGGYPIGTNRRTIAGKLFRSDRLSHLSEQDVTILNQLGIKTVVDFRSEHEREIAPDHLINESVNHVWLPLRSRGANVVRLREAIEARTLTAEGARQHLINANAEFVEKHSDTYSAFMSVLLEPSNYPLVFHCSAGKDRAGFAAASVLMNLGASKEVVMHDYLATDLLHPRSANRVINNFSIKDMPADTMAAVKTLMQVHPDYIGTAFATIDRLHGDIDSYLTEAQGMSDSQREKLANILCESS